MNRLFTVKETAKLLRLHEVSVRRLVAQKKIHATKVGGKLYINPDTLGLTEDESSLKKPSASYGDLLRQGKASIGVWGVGYIGFSTLVYFAKEGVRGLGYDIDARRVDQANRGEVDIPGLSEWLNIPVKNLIAHRLISATASPDTLLSKNSLVHFICVPTERHGEPWLGPLKDVIKKMVTYFSSQKTPLPPLIILESTVTPGTSGAEILRVFHRSGLTEGKDFLFAVAPRRDWFVDKAKTLKELDRVYGASDEHSAQQTKSVLSIVCSVLHQASGFHPAEMVKSVENAFRHMDITLANQLTMAYPSVSMREVLRLVGTKWNAGTFYPSFGTGGYCIPLSSKYVINGAEKPDALTLLKETIATDSGMPKCIAYALAKHHVKSVGILGLSYKGNLKVPHQSPAIGIALELRKRGTIVRINDPYYDKQEIRTLTGCSSFEFPEGARRLEALVVVAGHAAYQSPSIRRVLDHGTRCRVIYDNVGIWQNLTYFKERGISYYIPGDSHWLS